MFKESDIFIVWPYKSGYTKKKNLPTFPTIRSEFGFDMVDTNAVLLKAEQEGAKVIFLVHTITKRNSTRSYGFGCSIYLKPEILPYQDPSSVVYTTVNTDQGRQPYASSQTNLNVVFPIPPEPVNYPHQEDPASPLLNPSRYLPIVNLTSGCRYFPGDGATGGLLSEEALILHTAINVFIKKVQSVFFNNQLPN